MHKQTPLQSNSHQQESSSRRRILMKQKSNSIKDEITLNLQKLDDLLHMIKVKRQQLQLNSIDEVEQGNTEDEIVFIDKNEKTVRKQRRLKFKYSIYREYEFVEQENRFYHNSDKVVTQGQQNLLELSQNDQFLLSQNENFIPPFDENLLNQEEFVLDLTKRKIKLNEQNSIKNSQFQQLSQTQTIKIQTRYNWIDKYLDHEFDDTIVRGKNNQGQDIQLLSFNFNFNRFQCKMIEGQQLFQMEGSPNSLYKLSAQEQLKINAEGSQRITYFDCQYNQFVSLNQQIQIQFPRHNFSIPTIQPSKKQQVVRLKLFGNVAIRVLIRNQNINPYKMQRIMIFKQIHSLSQNDEKYKIVWTKYDKQSFIQDLVLQGGTNYLITNMCNFPCSNLHLIFTSVDIDNIKLQKTEYDPWRSYNMLCSSFQECSKVFMSQNIYDDSKPLQFLRANFLDYGLVLEIYQNVYAQEVAFLQNRENQENRIQDKQLLFPQIYTKLQNLNVYLPDELVINFFQVTQKPARLYFPKKRVLIGDKMVEHVTVHSTFK